MQEKKRKKKKSTAEQEEQTKKIQSVAETASEQPTAKELPNRIQLLPAPPIQRGNGKRAGFWQKLQSLLPCWLPCG